MSERARKVLGVSAHADAREIREAYRRLVKTAHPDLNPDDPGAEHRFRTIQEAFHELTEVEQRPRAEPVPPPRAAPSPPPKQQQTQTSAPYQSRGSMGVLWWLPVVVFVILLIVISAVINDNTGTEPVIANEICVRVVDPATGDGEPVNCNTPHEISLFQRGAITGFTGSYPGEDALETRVGGICDRSFRTIMGDAPDNAGYVIRARYPDSAEWTAGDRDFDCLAATATGELISGPLAPEP